MDLAEPGMLEPMTHATRPPEGEPWDAEYQSRWPVRDAPPPWVSRLGLMFGWLIFPFAWLYHQACKGIRWALRGYCD